MTERSVDRRSRRLLVAVPVTGEIRPLLRHAARLAALLQADLASLLIEEEDLWQMAALPFVQQVSFATARVEPLEEADLRRHLVAVGRIAEQVLGEVAREAGVAATLGHVRGRIGPALLAASLPGDIVLLHTRPRAGKAELTPESLAEFPACDVLVVQRGHAEPRRIVVCDDGSPAAAAALQLLGGLARRTGRPITVLGLGRPPSGSPAATAFQQLPALDSAAILTACAAAGDVLLAVPVALADRIGTERLLGGTAGLLLMR